MSDKIREAFDAWIASVDKRRDANGWEPLTARDVNMLREGYMEAALAQQPAPAVPDGWQPIETAPKDGTEIILRKGDRVTAGAWAEWSETYPEFHGTTGAWLGNVEYESGAVWASWDGGFAEGDEPEHWMPLPSAAPVSPAAQEPVAWQFREIGEGEWQDCDEAWHDYCYRSPQHDTRRLYTAPPAAEQPNAWTPSDADYDRSIHHNPDAAAWADLFVATFPGLADKRDLMLGWFANAMMAMHDHLKAQQPDTVAVPRATAIALLDEGSRQETWVAQDELRALLAGGAE